MPIPSGRMQIVVSSLAKALSQLFDQRLIGILVKSLLITLIAFVLAGALIASITNRVLINMGVEFSAGASIPIAILITAVGGWFLFRLVGIAVLQFFADEVVAAVEERHYPAALDKAIALPFRRDLANSLRGIARTLLFNLVALPVALILAFTAIGPAIIFFVVNAVLLGRELTDMAWLRHSGGEVLPSPVPLSQRVMLGGAITGLMMVPFVNMLAPMIGAAAGTHVTQAAMRKGLDAGDER